MEKPYSGLTALVQLNGVKIGYINNVELNLSKEVVDILQFGAQYKEKLPTIKDWSATSEGTAAFASGESQHKLYQAFESGELVTLTIKLDNAVYFQGSALVTSLKIASAPAGATTINVEFAGSNAITFILPETIIATISSSVGGTTDPAGTIRVAKGGTLSVTCTPAAGKKASEYTLNGGTPVTIVANQFTTAALSADTAIAITFDNV